MSATEPKKPQSWPRHLFLMPLAAAAVGLIITLSFGYADHDPQPHGVRIAVLAPSRVISHLDAGLQAAAPGGFDLVPVSSAASALRQVRSQSAAGGYVVPARGPVTIVTAAAAGTSQQTVIMSALTAASQALHRQVRAQDVAPLPPGDRAGLSSFVFGLGLLIPSVIGSIGLFLVGARRRLWWRVAAGTVLALLVAGAGVFALNVVFGALAGNAAALLGIGFLGSLSFVLFVVATQSLTGLPGTALGALVFIFVGNAISGGTTPIAFLPNGFRQLAPWLPNGAIIRAARTVIYLPDQSLGHPLLVLGLWIAESLAVLGGVDLLHRAERHRQPGHESEIYATPGIVHVRRGLARTRDALSRVGLPA